MPPSAFLDPSAPPTTAALAKRVGKALHVVEAAMEGLGGKLGQVRPEWHFSKTSGWYLTYERGAKRLFYLFPRDGDLLLKLVYNERGVEAIRANALPAAVHTKLADARTYAEGTVLEFAGADIDAELLTELVRIKGASMR